ncbi:MAG TPA: metallophosphoesterase [Bacteroidales bacterium]|nr:metallophosphoesterase [Bacteroidales bacterium]
MADKSEKTRIAAVADIHVKATDKGVWTDYFREISKRADIFLIGGDLTYTGDEAEAEVLSEELKQCNIPVVVVLGNHDHEKGRNKLIRQIVQNEHVHVLEGEIVVVDNIGIAGVKGFGGGFDNHMLSLFGEEAMKSFVKEAVNEALNLDRALKRLDQEHENAKKVVLMHYSPIKSTVVGEPEQVYAFLGCSRLEEPLNHYNDIVAVFHGHAHKGYHEGVTHNGVKVYNVAWPILQKAGFEVPVFILEV